MKYLRMLQLLLAALVWCPVAGYAQNLVGTIGGTSVNLVAPSGYCVTNPANSADRAFVNYLSKLLENSKNKLIRVVIDCGELQARRADGAKPIYDYVTFYFPVAGENNTLNGDTQANRKALCDELRQQTDAALTDVPQIVEKTAREMKTNASVSNTKYLGVLDADPHGCYGGLLVSVAGGKGNVTVIYVIVVRTVMHGKDLWLGVYSKYGSAADSNKSLQLAKTMAAALDAKNPE
ncbi:MAG TPA: hypothetical protein VG100_00255 [Xanthobacteraceae bacterium]|jgi:hypothetical protein|nr:hypothetical protein [Xanthobacteraceae bacterium]